MKTTFQAIPSLLRGEGGGHATGVVHQAFGEGVEQRCVGGVVVAVEVQVEDAAGTGDRASAAMIARRRQMAT